MTSKSVYIIDALRTPMARPYGKLAGLDFGGLCEALIRQGMARTPALSDEISQVIVGNAVSAGTGQNAVRKAVIRAGLSDRVPGYTVGNVCASGLQAVINASHAIVCGDASVILAAAAESVTHMPRLIFSSKKGDEKKGERQIESLAHDGLFCSVTAQWMGDLCERVAQQFKISRREQDDYAYESYRRAAQANHKGLFEAEIVPVDAGPGKKITEDETLRKNIERDNFDRFQAVFQENGTITAANSAAPCDGGAMAVLCSEAAVKRLGAKPLARIAGHVSIAGNPLETFELAARVVECLLEKTKRTKTDIDVFEISEAFSAQMIFTLKTLGVSPQRVNPLGGDVALGHPLGAAGLRGLVTLSSFLKNEGKKTGIVCACLGGGGAVAVLIERV